MVSRQAKVRDSRPPQNRPPAQRSVTLAFAFALLASLVCASSGWRRGRCATWRRHDPCRPATPHGDAGSAPQAVADRYRWPRPLRPASTTAVGSDCCWPDAAGRAGRAQPVAARSGAAALGRHGQPQLSAAGGLCASSGALVDLTAGVVCHCFRIEQRFGFNRMTLGLAGRPGEGALVGAVIGLPAGGAGAVWIMQATGRLVVARQGACVACQPACCCW